MTDSKISKGRREALKFASVGAGAATVAAMAITPTIASAAVTTAIDAGGSIDNQPAIQNAIDAAADTPADGGIVRLEEGNHRLNRPLILREGVTLVGAGSGTRLEAGTNIDMPFMIELPARSHTASIRSLHLAGRQSAGGIRILTAGGGVFSGSDSYALVENVFITDTNNHGIQVASEDNNRSDTREIRLHNVVVLRPRTGNGIQFNGVDSIITNCTTAGATTGHGIRVTGANNRITGHKSFFNFRDGLRIEGSRTQLSACQSQDNEGDGIVIEDAADVALSACGIDSNGSSGLRIRGCTAVAASGISVFTRNNPANGVSHNFGVNIQNSNLVTVSGVSRQNRIAPLRVVQSSNIDTSGLLTDRGDRRRW